MRRAASSLVVVLCLSAFVLAESAKSLHTKGQHAEARQDYEAAYEYYKAAYNQKPEDLRFRVSFERIRFLASSVKIHKGQRLRDAGQLQDALALFQQAAAIDPGNDLAAQEIRRTQQMLQKATPGAGKTPGGMAKAEEDDPLRRRLEQATSPAELGPISNAPMDAYEATEDTKVIYETIGKLAGVNILFDPDYTSRRLSIHLRKVSLQEALDIVALESRTFWRPVTPNTIFVAQDTQAKRRELEQNVVKTFYLGNVSGPTDLQDIVNAIRTVLEVQRIQQIPSQSAIIIKGTPDQLALAQKMIDDIDKSKPEVIVDVIVVQVRRDKLRDFGIVPPQNATVALQGDNGTSTTTGGTTTGTGTGLNFNSLQHLNSTNYAVAIDPIKATLLFTDSDARILQSPRIRATDNEKARVAIADKIPIATGSFGTPLGVGTAVGAVGVNTQFTYTDVGVILEVTPRVHPDGEVTLKTTMEISNVSGSQTIGGITQPIISQRKVEHTVRLADGEMNLLGGIMEVQETKSSTGTPFLGEIPILKYLFSDEKRETVHNEIVFLLVPHIVRGQELTDLNKRAFDVGTGSGIDLHIGAKHAVKAESVQPAATQAPAVAPAPAPTPTRPAPITPAPVTPAPATQQPAAQPATQPAVPRATGAAGPTTLKLDPGAVTPQLGATFTLNVQMSNGQDITSVLTQISYDARVLQFVSVSNGDFLSKDGQAIALVHRDDPSAGKLQITAQRPPGSTGVSGDGTVFSLIFAAKSKGSGAVSIAIPGARNSQNQPLEVGGSQATITVN